MFVKDCNTCWCNEDGTSYFCTRKVCVSEVPEETEEQGPEEFRILKRQCRPDEVFELDCNTCRCNPDGKSFYCTRRACLHLDSTTIANDKIEVKSRKTRDTNSKELPKACLPGQEFRMDCNKCLCDNEGQDFSCTRNDCAAQNNNNGGSRKRRSVAQQAVQHCEPGSVFDVDCNVCRCTSDGHHATCTLKRCPTKNDIKKTDESSQSSDTNFRCNPGEQFHRGCNDCTCSADGKSVFCTLLLCEKDLMPKL